MQSNNLKLAFAEHGVELLDVRHFSIHEAMSELFEVSVLATSHDDNINLDSIVGKGAAFRVETPNYKALTTTRVWAGIVAQMSQLHAEPGQSTYQVLLVPTYWRTRLRRNSRIFQHLTTPEIVQKVLAEWQITPVLKLQQQYKKHEYCVQYAETDYAFISRLLEEAGITFYFKSVADAGKGEDITKLVLNDAPHLNEQRGGPLVYAGHQTPRFGGDKEFCATVTVTQRVKPGRFTVRDFDFRLRPDTPLLAKGMSGTNEDVYEQYDYAPSTFWWEPGPGGDTPVADDKGIARTDMKESVVTIKRNLESERRRKLVVSFHSNALDLCPGTICGLNQDSEFTNHPRGDLSPGKKLLLTEMNLEGEHNGDWSMTASGVFAEFTYRPERRTPKPRIYGVQSAIVVGPPGQDIYTDEFGRVRVQFHWDREGKYDSNSSCWMRVSQAWAGGAFGAVNVPRVGHEVLVEFFEGDPDQPVVSGRVYNATTAVPYELPKHMTQSGWKSDSSPGGGGFNEIRFEDKKNEEHIHVQAQLDLSTIVKHDEQRDVVHTRSSRIGSREELDVGSTRFTRIGEVDSASVGELHLLTVGDTVGTVMTKDKRLVFSTGEASFKIDGPNIYINTTAETHFHAGKEFHISSQSGTITIQGGPDVTINDAKNGPAPEIATVSAAEKPAAPAKGEISGPPLKPSGGGSILKPGAIEDVTVGDDAPPPPAKSPAYDKKEGVAAKSPTKAVVLPTNRGFAVYAANNTAVFSQALADQKTMLLAKKQELATWDDNAKANFERYFGPPTDESHKLMQDRVDKMLALNDQFSKDPASHFRDPISPDEDDMHDHWAEVRPADSNHVIVIGDKFPGSPPTGTDSKAGVLCHEMSHFNDIGGTQDNIYHLGPALQLAKDKPADALMNADSFEYYCENAK